MEKCIKKGLLIVATVVLMMLAAVPIYATSTFVPRTTAPSTTNKYYLHTSAGGVNECILIGDGSCLPNCVGYAWGRAYEILGTKPKLSKGNADKWYGYNKNGGYYSYGSTPKLGAIMCWGGQHVAVVEKIEGNYITISESSYGGKRFNVVRKTISAMEDRTEDFQGYIYIGDFGSVTETPMTITFYPNKGTGTMNSISTVYGKNFTIPECGFQRTGYSFGGWAGYRPSDKTYFVSGQGWLTQSVIDEKGYQKRVYSPGETHTLNTSWTKDPIEHNVIGFAAFWNLNFYHIEFDANGGSGSIASKDVQLTEKFDIPEGSSLSRPGYVFKNWNAYRTSDNTYYVAGTGWFTEEEIRANGYTKRPYNPGETYYINDTSWLSSDPSNNDTSFIFVADWEYVGLPVEDIFVDVSADDWYRDAVQYVFDNNIMTGMDATHFGPYGNLSRAQFALMLYRMEGEPSLDTDKTFKDIVGNEWYGPAVLWAAENGIVTGYMDGNFGPADMITREQMAVMMYRYANYLNRDTSDTQSYYHYLDADRISAFAAEAMGWAVGEGIITGKENGAKLDPQGDTARAEAAVIIQRFMQ